MPQSRPPYAAWVLSQSPLVSGVGAQRTPTLTRLLTASGLPLSHNHCAHLCAARFFCIIRPGSGGGNRRPFNKSWKAPETPLPSVGKVQHILSKAVGERARIYGTGVELHWAAEKQVPDGTMGSGCPIYTRRRGLPPRKAGIGAARPRP